MTGIEIRPPELTGGTEREQLSRIQSYLYTLSQQLQYAFDALETGSETKVVTQTAQQRQAENLTALKSLIIKSAQVTEVLEQRVEQRLEGKYVAVSQFGTYEQETSQLISANSQAITQQLQSVQKLTDTVSGLDETVKEVSASIRTGQLADGVYGVEIGQQEAEDGVIRFRRFARLTAEKLSFYDSNETEVAYISNRRLYVTSAVLGDVTADSVTTPTLQMGAYTWQLAADGHLSLR